MMHKLNVLSLFDGCSCGQVTLKRVGIKVDKYYASEINPNSIKITQKNFPNTIQLGDVKQITKRMLDKLDKIDLLIGGSPCEDLTITQSKTREGLKGEKSKLFYEYIRIKNYLQPTYFFLENVESMADENRDIITKIMGVDPIMIDSALVSAQERKRYYWTNIPLSTIPKDKGLVLRDIMEKDVAEKYYYNKPFEFYGDDKRLVARLQLNCHDMGKRVYNPNFKAPTLTAVQGGYQEKKVYDNGRCRKLTPIEYERLQTLPDNYTYGVSDTARYSLCGDGWNVDTICLFFENIK